MQVPVCRALGWKFGVLGLGCGVLWLRSNMRLQLFCLSLGVWMHAFTCRNPLHRQLCELLGNEAVIEECSWPRKQVG